MIFSSILFILVFLPVFLLIYYIVPVSGRNVVLLIGSLFFYAYGEPRYIFLLLGSILVNYILGRGLGSHRKILKRFCLLLGVSLNLGLLLFFKWAPGGIMLPLGVSFYTFQSISSLVDVYQGDIASEHSLLRLGTYISMFPQLVAGPIVTYGEVEKQLKNPKVSIEDFDQGLKDFTIGLVMKVLLADRLTLLWKEISTIGYSSISTPLAWLGVISFSLQIYFDFFGYSMMAVGLGRMLGFRLPENFHLPYMACSVREFYRRWHMTLGRWFTKYVYIPLGGSRGNWFRTILNLFIVWVMTSVWHGTSVNFFLWGMLLFAVIVIEKMVSPGKKTGSKTECKNGNTERKNRIVTILKHIYVLLVIGISWVCFAITDMNQLMTYLGRMFGILPGISVNHMVFRNACMKYGVTILIGMFMCTDRAHRFYKKAKDNWLGMILLTALFWMCIWYLIVAGNNPFLYFRF